MDRDVKHGCCSCAYYKLPMSKEPCKSCERWSRWEDKDNGPNRAVPECRNAAGKQV